MDTNTRRLREFVTLAETLHFTHAAEVLHISQQGLSRSLTKLEMEVGVPLLDRTTRSVTLTEAGKELLQQARRALAELDAGAEAARRLHRQRLGILRLGFIASSALELTPLIIDEFRSRHPSVALELESYSLKDPSCGLQSGETDIAFVRLPIDLPNLHTEHIFVEPRAVALPRGHPLASLEAVRLADLTDQAIVAPRTTDASWRAFWTLRDTGLNDELLPRVSEAPASVEEGTEIVSAGISLVITILSMARFMPRSSIVYRPIVDVPGSALVLAWRGSGTPYTAAFRSVTVDVRDREAALVAQIEAGRYPGATEAAKSKN